MHFIYRFIYGGIHTALVKNQPKSKNVKYHYFFLFFPSKHDHVYGFSCRTYTNILVQV